MKYVLGIALLALGLASSAAYAEDAHAEKRSGGGHFQKADTDGDGSVSKAEFMAQAEERFGKMDLNGDGTVTKDEVDAKKEEYKKMKAEKKAAKEAGAAAEKAAEEAAPAPAVDPAPAEEAPKTE